MSSYTSTIRYFSLTPIPSIALLQVMLGEMGYGLRPAGTNTVDLFTSLDDPAPVRVELARAPDVRAQQEILAWIEYVGQMTSDEALAVLNALAKTQTLVMIHVPDYVDEGVLTDIVECCAQLGKGLVQVDGEGFYEAGVLVLRTD